MSHVRRKGAGGSPSARRHLRLVRGEPREHWLAGIFLRPDPRVTVGRQLEAHVSRAIGEGRLAPGSGLPSTRRLAGRLPIHRNTVAAAYRRLARRGLVTVRQGRVARVVSVPGLGADDGSAGSALVRGEADVYPGWVPRIAVVAAGKRHRWALVGDLARGLGGDAEVYPVSPKAALAAPGLLTGRIPVVELPFIAGLLPLLRRTAPLVALRYAPVAPVIQSVRHASGGFGVSTALTCCPRTRRDLHAMAAGLGGHVFAPDDDVDPATLRSMALNRGPVWSDWLRGEEALVAAGGRGDAIHPLPLAASATVRQLQRLILAGDGR